MNVPAFVRSALLGGATVLVLSCGDRSPLGVNARAPTIQGDLLDSLVQTAQQSAGLLRCSPIAADSVTQTIGPAGGALVRSEEHTSELQSRLHLVCRLLLEKKKTNGRQRQARP